MRNDYQRVLHALTAVVGRAPDYKDLMTKKEGRRLKWIFYPQYFYCPAHRILDMSDPANWVAAEAFRTTDAATCRDCHNLILMKIQDLQSEAASLELKSRLSRAFGTYYAVTVYYVGQLPKKSLGHSYADWVLGQLTVLLTEEHKCQSRKWIANENGCGGYYRVLPTDKVEYKPPCVAVVKPNTKETKQGKPPWIELWFHSALPVGPKDPKNTYRITTDIVTKAEYPQGDQIRAAVDWIQEQGLEWGMGWKKWIGLPATLRAFTKYDPKKVVHNPGNPAIWVKIDLNYDQPEEETDGSIAQDNTGQTADSVRE